MYRAKERLERRMQAGNGLSAQLSFDVGIHELACDRTWADDGNLLRQVLKALRSRARQRGHLGSALDLK